MAQLSVGHPGPSTRTAAAVVESAVPSVLAGPLRRALEVEVSDVVVRRGDDVAAAAHRLGARGYTQAGVVHVPDSAGALDSGEAGPLLAHELTHVAQQRRFGDALPAPGTAAGHRLEAEAVVVEQWYAAGAGDPPPDVREHLPPGSPRLRHRTTGVQAAPRESWDGDAAGSEPAPPVRAFETFTPGAPSARNLPDADQVPDSGLLAMYEQMRAVAGGGGENGGEDEPPSAVTGGGRVTSGGAEETTPELTIEQITDVLADDPPRRWMDLDDTDDFEELADRLYNHLVSRLRFDVLVERERSGTLLDFG